MAKKVSIIIPFYNVDKDRLDNCLKSVVNQTYKNIETILINDGSNYAYNDVIDKYSDSVLYYSLEHVGVSDARNLGLKKMTGDYFFFLDSDDYLEKNSIEKLVTLANNEYDIVISSAKFIDSNTGKINNVITAPENTIIDDNNKKDLLKSIIDNKHIYKCVETPWGKLYNKKVLEKYRIKFDSELIESEDGIFNFEIYSRASKIYLSNDLLYNYVVHNNSACNTYNPTQNEFYPFLIKKYVDLFRKLHNAEFDAELDLFSMRVFCRLIRKYYSHESNFNSFKKKVSCTEPNFKHRILNNSYDNLTFGRRIIKFLLKNKFYYSLYLISKSKIKIK